jgi:hypothetical protein
MFAPWRINMVNRFLFAGCGKTEWKEPDLSIVDEGRIAPPGVPLALVPEPWRNWIAATAAAVGAPQDYVFQTVLAGVAGVCGAGVRVAVTPAWSEPLVLWQAAVGGPSSGKSAALVPVRRMLAVLEAERRLGDEARREARNGSAAASEPFVPSCIVMTQAELGAVVETVAGNPRGVLLWRDSPALWFAGADDGDDHRGSWLDAWTAGAVSVARHNLASFPVSILETTEPDRLKTAMVEGATGQSARFLYAWPGPQTYAGPVARVAVDDEEPLARLRRLSQLARTPDDPCELRFDERGVTALDEVLADLHAARSGAEGLEAAWLGKGKAFVARLAGVLELLAFAGGPHSRPGAIGREQVEAAAALWRDYFWPHARAVFDSADLSDHKRRVRRVARWLRATRPKGVSREEVRRRALGQAATADETQHVLERLDYLGYVQPDPAYGGRGRPANRWLVNPTLAEPVEQSAETA